MRSIKDTWLECYADRKVEDSVKALAGILRDANLRRVLDFGTGTGRHTVYLASLGFDVYGFDWSENAITLAHRELAKKGLSATLTVWDMNQSPLPYLDGMFDAVFAVRVLHHTYLQKIEGIASEIARITKAGGYLYLEVPTYEKAIKQKLEGVRSEEPEPGTFLPHEGAEAEVPHHHFKLDELLKVFEAFEPRAIEEKNGHYCYTGVKRQTPR